MLNDKVHTKSFSFLFIKKYYRLKHIIFGASQIFYLIQNIFIKSFNQPVTKSGTSFLCNPSQDL